MKNNLLKIWKNKSDEDIKNFINRSYEGFPYIICTQGSTDEMELEQWCWNEFGPNHGKCIHDEYRCNVCDVADIDHESCGEKYINFLHCIIHDKPIEDNFISEYYGIDREFLKNNFTVEQIEKLKIQPSRYEEQQQGYRTVHFNEMNFDGLKEVIKSLSDNTIADLIDDQVLWDSEGNWWKYEHSHWGSWSTKWLGKTGYDYGFFDFMFKNLEDAILFRMSHAI